MASERLAPDALLETANLSGAVTAIDEDPDSPDASWLTAASNNAQSVARVSFPTPSNPLTTGAGLQEFRVQVRKMGGTGTPQARIELYQNGTLVSTVLSDTNVTSTSGVVLSGTWDATGRTASQIECRVVGTQSGGNPSTRAALEVGAIEWNATTSTNVPGNASPGLPALTMAVLPATADGGAGGGGGGAIAFVKEVSNFPDADGASHAIPISAAPVDGNLLVLSFITSGGDSVTAAVTDSAGNTWTERKTAPAGTSVTAYLYDCVPTNPLSTSDTVTVTLTASRGFAAVINEYEGQDADYFDVTAGLGDGNTGVVTFDSGATATTAQADEMAVAIFAHVSSSAGTITLDDTSYTARGSAVSTGTIRSVHTYDKVLTATGAQQFSGSYTTSRQSAAIVATYKAAAAAGGSTATPGTPALTVEVLPVRSVGVHHARDTFTRTVSPGFGTPDLGPDWTAYDAGTTNWATTGSTGTISVPDSTYQNATIGDGVVDVVDSRTTIRFRWQSIPEGGFHTLAFYGRRQADILDKAIKTNVRVASTGAVTANSENKVGGVNTNLIAYTDTGLTVAANDWVLAEMEVEGQYPNAHVRVRVWLDGTPRPASPLYDATTTGTDVDPGGTTGVWVQGSTSGSQVTWPVVFEVDEISLVAIDGTPPDFGGTAQPGTPALTTAVLAATASGAAHVDTALASVSLAALTATASGAGTASPGTAALTAAVLAANASGGAVASPGLASLTLSALGASASGQSVASPGLPSLTASALAATATAAAVASPGTPSLTIAALAATASNGASTPTNFALLSKGATATASTTWTNPYLPNTAIDDDDQTGWASSTEPNGNWLRVDLGQNRRVNGYRLIQGTFGTFDRNNHADTWNVQYSDDDSTWTTAISNDAYTVDTGVVNFTEETHRYWRVLATSDTVSGGWVVTAFELWGDVTSADVERGSGTRTNNGESQTTLSATTMPTHDTDDTLIAVVGWKNTPTRTATTPVGWTKIDQVDGSGHSLAAYAKQAESSSETFSIVLSGAAAWSEVHVWRLSPAQVGTPATTNDTTSDTAAQIPGLTYDPTGMGQVLTVAMTARGDRSLTAITGTDSSLGGNNQSWAPYFAMMSMWDTFEGTDPASTSATINNGADTSVALRVGFTGVATGGAAGTANPGTATATAAVLAATASGAALASPGTAAATAAALAATASGQAVASPGLGNLTAAAQAATATGAALAQPGTPELTIAALAATVSGAAHASSGTASASVEALAATATGAASAQPGTAAATAAALAATASGAAIAQPGTPALTVAVRHATASGGTSIPGTASPGIATATAAALAATASGAAVAQPGTPSLSLSAAAAIASGAAIAQPGSATATIEALHATVVAGGAAVAQPGLPSATAAVLAATASGAAQVTTTRPALTITVLPATAHGSAAAQPGTPALSTSAGAATATGAGRAQPGAATATIDVLPATATAAALVSTGLAELTVEALHATASGGTSIPATANPGTPALSIAAFATTASGAGRAQPGAASVTVEVLPVTATAAARISAGLAQATVAVLPASASGAGLAQPGTPALTLAAQHIAAAGGGLPGGPISAVTRSVEYAHAFTRSLLRDYAITNSLDSLFAAGESLATLAALTYSRDGMAGSTESEED